MLFRLLRTLLRADGRLNANTRPVRRVLNAGGGSKSIPIPAHFEGWEHVLLDIDPRGTPDIACDARRMASLPAERYDAVYRYSARCCTCRRPESIAMRRKKRAPRGALGNVLPV